MTAATFFMIGLCYGVAFGRWVGDKGSVPIAAWVILGTFFAGLAGVAHMGWVS